MVDGVDVDEIQETQSALGSWTIHLKGAFSIIEASGGIEKWTSSPRAAVQVGLLVWYAKSIFEWFVQS